MLENENKNKNNEAAQEPNDDNYPIGNCPKCGKAGQGANHKNWNWGYCEECKLYWSIGNIMTTHWSTGCFTNEECEAMDRQIEELFEDYTNAERMEVVNE